MSEFLESMKHSFNDPVTRHAMLVHFPIVLSMVLVPFIFALPFLSPGKSRVYRVILAASVFTTAVITWQAGEAGEAAEPIVQARMQSEAANAVLTFHATWGERIPLFLAGTSILVGLTLVPLRSIRVAASLASIAAILGCVVAVAVVAHEGGQLVYRHGAAGDAMPGPRN